MFGEDDKSGVTAWAEAIKINTSITELNIAKNYIDAGDAKILSPAIGANRAMKKLTISGDQSYSKPVTIETSMTEARFSSKYLEASGAIMLAAFLPKCQ